MTQNVGLEYERLAAGKYKDAGTPFMKMIEGEREYPQSLIDGYYDEFVERVTDGRELSDEQVRDTEASVFAGEEGTRVDGFEFKLR